MIALLDKDYEKIRKATEAIRDRLQYAKRNKFHFSHLQKSNVVLKKSFNYEQSNSNKKHTPLTKYKSLSV